MLGEPFEVTRVVVEKVHHGLMMTTQRHAVMPPMMREPTLRRMINLSYVALGLDQRDPRPVGHPNSLACPLVPDDMASWTSRRDGEACPLERSGWL
jgi:hypothetical protein